ncbi:hypothetical protein GCM10023159_11720 [Brevibacterium yomogidense]
MLALGAQLGASGPVAVAQQADAPAPDSAAEAPTTDPTASPHVVLDEVTPWLDQEGALTVTGRIVNPTADDFAPASVSVVRSSTRMSMRDDVNRWVDRQRSTLLLASSDDEPADPPADGTSGADDADDGPSLAVPNLPASVAPGDQVEFSFTIPADVFGPGGSAVSSWGAYGLGVTLNGTTADAGGEDDTAGSGAGSADDASTVQTTAPAFTVWHPDPGIDPTEITTVIPVTLDAVPDSGAPFIDPDLLEQAADPDATGDYSGALHRVTASARALPDSVLAVDPRLLASVGAALEVPTEPDTGTDEGTEADDSASDDPSPPADTDAPSETGAPDDAGAPAGSGSPDGAEPSDAADPPDDRATADEPEDANAPRPGGDVQPTDEPPDSAGEAEDGSDEQPTAPSESAQQTYPHLAAWYEDLTKLSGDHDVMALPWADAHLTSLWHADMGDLAESALADREIVGSLLGGRTGVLWPADGTVRTDDLGAMADTGADTVILSDIQQPALTSYTSSANSAIAADGARPHVGVSSNSGDSPVDGGSTAGDTAAEDEMTTLRTLVADSGLAEAAAGHTSASTTSAPGQFLALSAAITAERPFDSRSLLLTLPRTAAGSGLTDFAHDVADAPWIDDTSLDALLDTEPVARAPLVDPSTTAGDGTGGPGTGGAGDQQGSPGGGQDGTRTALAGLQTRYASGADASDAFVDADGTRRDMARALLACTSTGVVDGGRIDSCADSASGWVGGLADGVRPEPGSSVLLVTGEQAMIPVRVDNSTDRTARVRLRVESPTPQLNTELSDIVTLGPGEARSVDVPVRGLANADVRSTVRLLTVDGDVLPQNTELLVRVRADWENTATIAIGSALIIVLVVGLVATIRRGRRKIPKNQLDAALARAQDG